MTKLDLHHRSMLEEYLAHLGDGLSEYTFPNLFLFRREHRYSLVFKEKWFVSGITYDGDSFLMPLFDLQEVDTRFLKQVLPPYNFFFPLSLAMVTGLDRREFAIRYNPDDSDYIYRTERFKTYNSGGMREKKDMVRRLLSRYNLVVTPISMGTQTHAIDILNQWLQDCNRPVADTDYKACLEALKHVDILGLNGCVYYAGSEPAGFLVYSKVLENMCTIHFAKGKYRFNGIYQYMFSHFAQEHADTVTYYNFEQDLGVPNFRRIKQSYEPDRMLYKYRVALIES